MAQAAVERQVEKTEELLAEGLVSGGIERAEKGEVLGGGHGVRQILAVGDVAELRAIRLGERARRFAENTGLATGRREETHEDAEQRAFVGAVAPEQCERGAAWQGEIERLQRAGAAVALGERDVAGDESRSARRISRRAARAPIPPAAPGAAPDRPPPRCRARRLCSCR